MKGRSTMTPASHSLLALLPLFLAACAEDAPAPALVDHASLSTLFTADPRVLQGPEPEAALAEHGERLFNDPSLSESGALSCATCHTPKRLFQSGRNTPTHIGGTLVFARNVPTLIDAGRLWKLGWVGNHDDLEQAIHAAFKDPHHMGGAANLEPETVPALAAYVRTLRSYGPWDRFVEGDHDALSEGARRGLQTFLDSGCATCHASRLLGGATLFPLGTSRPYETEDPGRQAHTGQQKDQHVFRAPPLRLAAHTAPYLHDGSIESLEETIRFMGQIQLDRELEPRTIADIATFLRAIADTDPLNTP